MFGKDLLQLRAVTSKNFIEKRRNIRVTLCEFFSHFILFLVLLMGFGLSKVLYEPAGQYDVIKVILPPQSFAQLRHLISGPVTAPTYSQYIALGTQIRSQISRSNLKLEYILRTPLGDQFSNLLLGGTLHLAPEGIVTSAFIEYLNSTAANFNEMDILVHESEAAAVSYILSNLNKRSVIIFMVFNILH